MPDQLNALVRGALRISRWSAAPLAFGLIAALVLVLVQFFRELWHAVTAFGGSNDGDVMIAVLKLVDLTLIANLVIMIIGAAAEMLAPRGAASEGQATGHQEDVAFGLIKLKLFASITAIAAIYLLERLINVHPVDIVELLGEILILLSFVVAGVMLAWMDRLSAERH